MTADELTKFITCLVSCSGVGWVIGISFGIAILMLLSILDIFKEISK